MMNKCAGEIGGPVPSLELTANRAGLHQSAYNPVPRDSVSRSLLTLCRYAAIGAAGSALIVMTACSKAPPPSDPADRYLYDRLSIIQDKVANIYTGAYAKTAFVSHRVLPRWGYDMRSVCGTYGFADKPDKEFRFIFTDWEGKYYSTMPSGPAEGVKGWSTFCNDPVHNAKRDPVAHNFTS